MKYAILIYANPKNWEHPMFLQYEEHTAEERAQLLRDFNAYHDNLRRVSAGAALEAPSLAKTVTERNGVVSITDGPFAETKEQLAGVVIVDCDSIDDAIEIAKHYPDIKYSAVEVRPVAPFPEDQ